MNVFVYVWKRGSLIKKTTVVFLSKMLFEMSTERSRHRQQVLFSDHPLIDRVVPVIVVLPTKSTKFWTDPDFQMYSKSAGSLVRRSPVL
jgi:hypothetical protein